MKGCAEKLLWQARQPLLTEFLPNPAGVLKAEREIAGFRKLQGLYKEFVDVNAQLCQPRTPTAGAGS